MLRSVVQSVTSFASDAYSSLIHPADQSDPTTVEHKILSDATNENKVHSNSSRGKRARMSEEYPKYTRSVTRFLNELEEEERSVLQKQKETEQSGSLRTGIKTSSATTPRTPRRVPTRSDERRALGIPEKSPPDAVKIPTPMSKFPSSHKGRLQPIDTLNQPRSSKGQFYFDHRYRDSKGSPAVVHNRPRTPSVQENDHEFPNKRQRIDTSSMSGSSRASAIKIDNSQDSVILDEGPQSSYVSRKIPNSLSRSRSRSNVALVKVDVPPPRVESGKKTLERRSSSPPFGLSRKFKPRDVSSPDELLDDDFTKKARQQRLQNQNDTPTGFEHHDVDHAFKQRMDDLLSSSSPITSSKRTPTKVKQTSKQTPGRRSSISRIERRLQPDDESPDALQGDCTTITPHRKHTTKSQVPTYAIDAPPSNSSRARNDGRERRPLSQIQPEEGQHVFPLLDYIYYDVPVSSDSALIIDERTSTWSLELIKPQLGKDPIFRMSVNKVMKMFISDNDVSSRIMISTNDVDIRQKLYFQFLRLHDAEKFRRILGTLGVSIQYVEKDTKWMDGAFERGKIRMEELAQKRHQQQDQPQPGKSQMHVVKTSHYFPQGQTGVKRSRMVDKLDNTDRMTIITGADRSGPNPTSDAEVENRPAAKLSSRTTTGNQSMMNPTRKSSRSTRSHVSKADDQYYTESPSSTKKASVFNTLTRWRKPLVYPLTGRKRETVHFDDLERLDDDEFLNDNLVCLFVRYLEEHGSKEQMRRIHFFNSFLFEALTKDVKSRREINFDSVKRWTAKVDLFNRDFVVVPVNEHLHWFVMIICNLSYFRRKHAPKQEDEEEDVDVIQIMEPISSNEPEMILKSDIEETNEASARSSFADMTLDESAVLTSSPTSAKSSTNVRGRRKQRRSLQKYDIDKPIIITLDSLDQSRSATASLLRQYIVAEARDKKGWEIDGNEIKGMTAKGIPHQNNFSDCGLYLCMYLEQFVLDPYAFVRRILQRDNDAGWPRTIESSDLRERLRNMLLKLHEQQHPQEQQYPDIPPLGSVLVRPEEQREDHDMQRLDLTESNQARFTGQREVDQEQDDIEQLDSEGGNRGFIDSVEDWQQMVNQPISVDDESEAHAKISSAKQQSQLTSPYFVNPGKQVNPRINLLESTGQTYGDPAALAKQLRTRRSPDSPTHNGGHRSRSRSQSASTEFLMGNESYTIELQPSTNSGNEVEQTRLPKGPHQRKYQRFKNGKRQGIHEAVEIEDSEFEGFPDTTEKPVLQQDTLAEAKSDNLQHLEFMKKEGLDNIATEQHMRSLSEVGESSISTDMLV